ncbi:MAG TPA: SurA N-terminal domain-containing protein [Actinomycetota bacterium]
MIPVRQVLAGISIGLVLSGCSGTFTPPAAVVNGTRISEQVLGVRLEEALASPDLASQLAGPNAAKVRADVARQVLTGLIADQIIERYARDHGIVVTGAEVTAELNTGIQQLGGSAGLQRFLRQRHLTLPELRTEIEEFLLRNKVLDAVTRALPPDASSQQRQAAFTSWVRGRMARADIEVNPRFGKFDPRRGAVCAVVSTAGDVSPSCGQPA